jgi:predicted acylesterase/phospholipase RssA
LLVAINVMGAREADAAAPGKPKIFEVLLTAFQIMEAAMLEDKLARTQPDYYIQPPLRGVDILDFKNPGNILESVRPEAEAFRQYLEKNRRKLVGV